MAPEGPGTEPRTSMRFSLGSIWTTSMPFWVTRLLPIWPGPRMPLKTREGVAEAPIEPGARTLWEPWGLGTAGEVVALDRALEAPALGGPGDLHAGADLEGLDGDRLAHLQLAGLVAELDQGAHRRRVGLLEVAELGLGQVLLLAQAERQLDGLVAVALRRADGRHRARSGLQDGHARDASVVLEDLGHAELRGEDGGHLKAGGSMLVSSGSGV